MVLNTAVINQKSSNTLETSTFRHRTLFKNIQKRLVVDLIPVMCCGKSSSIIDVQWYIKLIVFIHSRFEPEHRHWSSNSPVTSLGFRTTSLHLYKIVQQVFVITPEVYFRKKARCDRSGCYICDKNIFRSACATQLFSTVLQLYSDILVFTTPVPANKPVPD